MSNRIKWTAVGDFNLVLCPCALSNKLTADLERCGAGCLPVDQKSHNLICLTQAIILVHVKLA